MVLIGTLTLGFVGDELMLELVKTELDRLKGKVKIAGRHPLTFRAGFSTASPALLPRAVF